MPRMRAYKHPETPGKIMVTPSPPPQSHPLSLATQLPPKHHLWGKYPPFHLVNPRSAAEAPPGPHGQEASDSPCISKCPMAPAPPQLPTCLRKLSFSPLRSSDPCTMCGMHAAHWHQSPSLRQPWRCHDQGTEPHAH